MNEKIFGSFSPLSNFTSSALDSKYFMSLPDKDDEESILAHLTGWHEWFHFLQYHSSTWGLHLTAAKFSQQLCIIEFFKFLKSNNVKSLYYPLQIAFNKKLYPDVVEEYFKRVFSPNWMINEININQYLQGDWFNFKKNKFETQFISPLIISNLEEDKRDKYLHKNISTSHILEPVANTSSFFYLGFDLDLPNLIKLMARLSPKKEEYKLLLDLGFELGNSPLTSRQQLSV